MSETRADVLARIEDRISDLKEWQREDDQVLPPNAESEAALRLFLAALAPLERPAIFIHEDGLFAVQFGTDEANCHIEFKGGRFGSIVLVDRAALKAKQVAPTNG